MNVLERIDSIMKKQGLTDYQLAKIAELSPSTISNMRRRNTLPSIPTLENICDSLNISLSQFFADDTTEMYPVTSKQKQFMDYFVRLTEEQQDLICEVVRNIVWKEN